MRIDAGWLDIPSGVFASDANDDVSGLPFTPAYEGQTAKPRSYDAQLARWLPVDQNQVAPDGRSYFYVDLGTTPPQLRLHDLNNGKDRTLWVDVGSVEDIRWSGYVILVTHRTVANNALVTAIDPSSGSAQTVVLNSSFANQALPTYGYDANGHPIVRSGGYAKGDPYIVFIDRGNGDRVAIYQGTVGDSTDFRPFGPAIDGDRLWFGNSDNRYVFVWSPKTGLQRFNLSGVGPPDGSVNVRPAGACRAH